MSSIIFPLPTHTVRPDTLARIPRPAISSTSSILQPSVASEGKASRRTAPMGWVVKCSTWAARCNSSCSSKPLGCTASTANSPWVSVPVLSNTTVPRLANVSIYPLPLMSIPLRDAAPMPPKNDSGTLMTKAQGQETTRNINALYNHVENAVP